ncbi:ATP phosphoribosyltransferase regulatory subunit [Scatolibacter rhodanostii]|uniref:ATP phosphoribosyltransferase regulatory subunit n=1 Tax=Scatolibacter rhodanostii TaxID=2014781 RepID=UPI000C06BF48|nr:ATP phosphoribosyltransferase regulatory subunit [Scatolibacter rhodanostii]
MKNFSRITPEGTKDILFEECKARRETERRLASVFLRRGYHEVLTPGIEFFDLFTLPGAALAQSDMYKMTDNNGRLMVLRPDSTLPIARMTASRLQNSAYPIRLFYNQSVYRNCPDLSGRNTELPQMGIELLGAKGLRADLEVISVAVQALASCSKQFRIEIGHAKLFSYFADKLPVSEEIKENIRGQIESKNYGALNEILSQLEPSTELEAIKKLPSLFGGAEALQAAEEYCSDEETRQMLMEMKKLYTALADFGLGERIIVDLGLVQSNDYYTGAVFSAYVEESGDAVLVGGRYDTLLEKFDHPMPAIGFCIDTAVLAKILPKNGDMAEEINDLIIVHSEKGFEIEGQKKVDFYNNQGVTCESSVCEKREETLLYAKSRGATKVVVVGNVTEEIDIGEAQA